MKLHISYDLVDLEHALAIAHRTAEYADVLEIGMLLIYRYGITAVHSFKREFPHKKLLVNIRLVDRVSETLSIFCSDADYVTVLAGAKSGIVRKACTTAHGYETLVVLDLLDAGSLGQAARDAKELGVDILLLRRPDDFDNGAHSVDHWHKVSNNSLLPVYFAGGIRDTTIDGLLELGPAGIVVSKGVTHAKNPLQAAKYFRDKIDALT